jgi:predicted nuclease of predicted toxin-antitoxin system
MSSRALLLDENLSPRLVKLLETEFPGIAHLSQYNLQGMPDIEIWRFAAEHDYCIVSTDSDFNQLAFVNGAPPQVIWLRMGEATTDAIADGLCQQQQAIAQFMAQDEQAVLEIP